MLANRSMIQCAVIPELAYPGVTEAVAWLCDAFGFSIRIRMGNHRAQLNVGDGGLVITELAGSGKRGADGLPAQPLAERAAMCCSGNGCASKMWTHSARERVNTGQRFCGRPRIFLMERGRPGWRTSPGVPGRFRNRFAR